AEKSHGNADRLGHLGKRESFATAQFSQVTAQGGRVSLFVAAQHAFPLHQLDDRLGIESAHAAQVTRAFKQGDVVGGVEAIFAGGAVGASEAKTFPGADDRRGDAYQAGDITDFEKRFGAVMVFAQRNPRDAFSQTDGTDFA